LDSWSHFFARAAAPRDYAAGTFVLEKAVVPLGERVAVVFLWLAGIAAAVWGAWVLCPTWFQLRSRSDYAFAAMFVTFPPLRSPITQLP